MKPIEHLGAKWWFLPVTWLFLQLWQHNCVWLCRRPGLHWSLLGLGPWYRACCVESVLSSLHMVVIPTISQPSMMTLIPFTDLHNLTNFLCHLFLLQMLSIDVCYSGTSWHHCTFPASSRKLITLALLLHNFGAETHSVYPHQSDHRGIGVSSSSAD